MTPVGSKVAAGAAWMVGLKFIERSVGFISTLILARLLVPADFGLVAMAMAVFGFIEVAGQFGFDLALIREQDAARDRYDSAWTLSVCYGLFSAILLVLLASPVAEFFSEPRLEPIVGVLAVVAMVQSFENIGIVNFRKELLFGKEFQLLFIKKMVSFVLTVSLAIALRSYWALVIGIAVSRVTGVVLSYSLHPYRPRIDLSQARTLFKFSKWIVLTRVIQYFGERGPDFFIGRFLGPGALGLYRVGHEIATLPTSELIAPIMRAVFPGYASVAHDRLQLVRSFLMVQGMIVMVSLPAGIGIAMLADSLVRAALGQNWLGAVPLIQVLGIYGSLTVFQATSVSIFNVLGVPHWSTVLKTIEVSVLLAAIFAVLEFGAGLQGVVWAVLGSQLLVIPLGMVIIGRLLPIGMDDRLRVIWRPVVAVGAMTGTLALLGDSSWFADMSAISSLAISIPIGAFVFITIVWVLWFISGSPEGTEKTLLTFLGDRIKRKQTMI